MHSKLKELGTDQDDIVKALMFIFMPILLRHHGFIHDRFSIKAKTKISISTSLHKSSEQAENNS
jgi:hypothetical protein